MQAARDPKDLCGLILASTPGRPLGEVLREQLEANPANAPVLADAEHALSELEAGRKVDVSALHPALRRFFGPAVQGFLISIMAIDPAKRLAAYSGPVAILQGDRDIQVSVADAERLKSGSPAAKLVILAEVNHILKAVSSDDREANIATYGDPNLPIAPAIVDAVVDFVKAAR